jgi:hypothetical protein
MSTVVDSYSESNYDGIINVGGTQSACGQSFTGDGSNLGSVKFYLKKNAGGPASGNLEARIYAHSGTFGTSSVATGAVLATSDIVNISTLPASGGSPSLIDFPRLIHG